MVSLSWKWVDIESDRGLILEEYKKVSLPVYATQR
jgi:hypothetical protein